MIYLLKMLHLFRLDSIITGNEEGEGTGPEAKIRTQEANSAMALYASALPTRQTAPTEHLTEIVVLIFQVCQDIFQIFFLRG